MSTPKLILHYLEGRWTVDRFPKGTGYATLPGEAVINIFTNGSLPTAIKTSYSVLKDPDGPRSAQ